MSLRGISRFNRSVNALDGVLLQNVVLFSLFLLRCGGGDVYDTNCRVFLENARMLCKQMTITIRPVNYNMGRMGTP